LTSLPLLFVSLIVIFFISNKIARPLNQLAHYTEVSRDKNQEDDLKQIKTFYYEAVELKKSLLTSFAYLHSQMNHLTEQSTTDLLTGLNNRRAFEDNSLKWIESNTPFSMVLIDIDNFKKVNDTYGHNIGDLVLQFLAKILLEGTRSQDVCYRYGGEEFVILLPTTTPEEAWMVVDEIRVNLSEKISPTGEIITFSAGISAFPHNGITTANITLEADKRLYQAKSEGKNRVIVKLS